MSRAGVIASYINNNFISHLLDMPHAASTALKHTNRSGNPSNLKVRLASRMGCAQLGQRGGVRVVQEVSLLSHMQAMTRPSGR